MSKERLNKQYSQGVSFCIATNGKKQEKTILEIRSIKEAMRKAPVPHEVIVSGDVEKFEGIEEIKLVKTPEDAHGGLLAKLRNNAAEKVQYKIIVFADDDLIFGKNWGLRLCEYSNQHDWDVLGHRVLLPNGGRYWDRCTYNPHSLIDYDAESYRGTLYQSGAFWIIKKRVYDVEKWDSSIGYYADRGGGINEDVEYSLRLQRKGFTISFDKENLVWHNDERYVEDVTRKRVLLLETAKNENLPIPPVKESFLRLKSFLLRYD
jgi:hypothetical protein